MNQLQVFNFGSAEFRTIQKEGIPWFVLGEVCKVLEIGNPSQVKTRLEDGVITNEVIPDALGRSQMTTLINEDGLYDVILESRKPEAKAFRKWVTSEVLPSIRKNGMYATDELLDNPDLLIEVATKLKEERQARIAAETKIELDKPKVVFAEALEVSQSAILVGQLAKLIRQNGIDIGQNRLFQLLREQGYLLNKGEQYNMPSQRSMEQGLFEIKTTTLNNPDGSVRVTRTTKVTGKGQIYFVNKFKKGA
ncbi:phage antirepressor Ant [Paenibacillus albiflavus]|uniref:Phage antirepressor Ant n=1 Tax=Paenibacillus albiflavus TaxID=2545760 RepID=A0A4R4ED37_9BACL|nr:phage antirepressor [Paenibacillus albiflavus]TCZ76071.1 phage antirepressor Ant [Paenibacillus albiflavus]